MELTKNRLIIAGILCTLLSACNAVSTAGGSGSAGAASPNDSGNSGSAANTPLPSEAVVADDGSITSAPMDSVDGSFTSEVTLD